MIRLDNMSYYLPQGFLYKNISMFVGKGDKIGLCGKNGIGKSTLLSILSGDTTPSEGSVVKEKGLNIGYLTQDIKVPGNYTVREYASLSDKEIKAVNERLEFVNSELSTRTDYESDAYHKLIQEITELNDRLLILGAYDMAERIELVLKGLGFKQDDFDKLIETLSGGWQMRAELAKLLVSEPDFLLIDEPTNHLDIISIQWLENYLKVFKGGLLIISHDKRFLDAVTNRTIEIANQRLYDYKCNYSNYLQQHADEMQRLGQAKKNQDREIKRHEDLIDKYRAKANKASFAQSLIKKLDKIERIEIDNIERRAFNVRFTLANPSGKRVLELSSVDKSYKEKHILKNLNGLISRGDKIALLGPNGVGKSTLIKAMTSTIEFDGLIEAGHNVNIGYFAQDAAENLDGNNTVYETIDAIANGDRRKEIRNILGAFLFGGDDVDKKVKVLSGGERTRLAICKLLFADYNFLILDEPTNHLDISSKEVLKEALTAYEGTLLLVSHDREFLDSLSNKIWEIRDGQIREHYFGVTEFLKWYSDQDIALEKAQRTKPSKTTEKPQRGANPNESKQLEIEIKRLEKKIADLEVLHDEKTGILVGIPFSEVDKYELVANGISEIQSKLDAALKEWEEKSLRLEAEKS